MERDDITVRGLTSHCCWTHASALLSAMPSPGSLRLHLRLGEALIFVFPLSVLSSPRPDAPPPALLAPM
jgi:hypothetical protein